LSDIYDTFIAMYLSLIALLGILWPHANLREPGQ
jgi:hypothetical protein